MSRFHTSRALKSSRLGLWPLLLALLCAGCSRPAGPRTDGDSQDSSDPHPVPFREGSGSSANADGPYDSGTAEDRPKSSGTAVPFRDSQNLPAGTLLAVRLLNSISASNPSTNLPFEGTIDRTVAMDGNVMVPEGAMVTGHVEAARVSKAQSDAGYVRLVLDSIDVGGVDTPVRTSTVFARGNAGIVRTGRTQGPMIRLEKDRVFTFRLAEPLYLASRREPTSR
jgi:hypothetical protein